MPSDSEATGPEIGPINEMFESFGLEPYKTTPLDQLHRDLGAKMVPFAGYEMPLQYPTGVMAEHLHCRAAASLFDVSHMGQASLHGHGATAALERMVPSDIAALAPMRQRYTVLTNELGGILDDLIVGRVGERLFLVANASRKDADFRHIIGMLPDGVTLEEHEDRALLALQGPAAAAVFARLAPGDALGFLGMGEMAVAGVPCLVSRSGYTGEDGFEISVPANRAEELARALLAEPEVKPAGLGARDSLRLEAGLCLYGADIDELTTPIEAGLGWVIGKRRRQEGGFLGEVVIRDQLKIGPPRMRVGIRPDGRAPARALTEIGATDGTRAGNVTSGGFSPTLSAPIAMGYVRRDLAAEGTPLELMVRGQKLPGRVVPLPFVPHRYIR